MGGRGSSMGGASSVTVISATGKQIYLTRVKGGVEASSGGISFLVKRTFLGLDSVSLVPAAGNKSISISLSSAEKTKADKLFPVTKATKDIRREAKEDAAFKRSRASLMRVINDNG